MEIKILSKVDSIVVLSVRRKSTETPHIADIPDATSKLHALLDSKGAAHLPASEVRNHLGSDVVAKYVHPSYEDTDHLGHDFTHYVRHESEDGKHPQYSVLLTSGNKDPVTRSAHHAAFERNDKARTNPESYSYLSTPHGGKQTKQKFYTDAKDSARFDKAAALKENLPAVRKRIVDKLSTYKGGEGDTESHAAAIAGLVHLTGHRVGTENSKTAKTKNDDSSNESGLGISTLRVHHITPVVHPKHGKGVKIKYTGKDNVTHAATIYEKGVPHKDTYNPFDDTGLENDDDGGLQNKRRFFGIENKDKNGNWEDDELRHHVVNYVHSVVSAKRKRLKDKQEDMEKEHAFPSSKKVVGGKREGPYETTAVDTHGLLPILRKDDLPKDHPAQPTPHTFRHLQASTAMRVASEKTLPLMKHVLDVKTKNIKDPQEKKRLQSEYLGKGPSSKTIFKKDATGKKAKDKNGKSIPIGAEVEPGGMVHRIATSVGKVLGHSPDKNGTHTGSMALSHYIAPGNITGIHEDLGNVPVHKDLTSKMDYNHRKTLGLD